MMNRVIQLNKKSLEGLKSLNLKESKQKKKEKIKSMKKGKNLNSLMISMKIVNNK
jgi:hypothetical protein